MRLKKYWNGWGAWLDRHSIKTKLVVMFFFCVLFPVISTNTLIIVRDINSRKAEEGQRYQRMSESVKYSIQSAIDRTIYGINDIYTSLDIFNFLETKYETEADFYRAYTQLPQRFMMHGKEGQNIIASTAYADNGTIVNMPEFARLEVAWGEQWFQDFLEADKKLLLYTYYDEDKKPDAKKGDTKRVISLIRKLDYYGSIGCAKIIKHDLNYTAIAQDIIKANYSDQVYVCDGDKILFDNVNYINGMKEYQNLSNEIKSTAAVKETINLYGTSWDIYIVGEKLTVSGYLQDSAGALSILILVNLLLPVAVMLGVSRSMSARILSLGEHLDMVKEEKFIEIEPVRGKDEISKLMGNYNLMVKKMKELVEVVFKSKIEQQESDISRQQAELSALHSQINPHFMFNALESIRMRSVIKGEEETSEIIGKLAVLMRKSINWGVDDILLGEEMKFAEAYLQLQKYRFGERMSYEIEIGEGLETIRIPKLTVVTFVENACIHGIEGMSRPGRITVSAKRAGEDLLIVIEDTGAGMTEEYVRELTGRMHHAEVEMLKDGEQVGITNACIRLQHYGKGQARFDVKSSKNIGTKVTISIALFR